MPCRWTEWREALCLNGGDEEGTDGGLGAFIEFSWMGVVWVVTIEHYVVPGELGKWENARQKKHPPVIVIKCLLLCKCRLAVALFNYYGLSPMSSARRGWLTDQPRNFANAFNQLGPEFEQ